MTVSFPKTISLFALLLVCFSMPVVASEYFLGFSSGYRADSLDWNIAADFSGSTPNILSELTWDDLQSFQVASEAEIVRPLNKSFRLVLLGRASYGWILSEQDVSLGDVKAPINLMNVYYPNVPTLVTGQVYSARKETIMKLGNPSREVVDILLYGLRRPDQLHYLPWDDETEAEFRQRAKRFGITDEFPCTPST